MPNEEDDSRILEAITSKEDLIPGTKEHPKEFGIFETKDKVWMGSSDCPLTYDNIVIAQIAAQVLNERLDLPMGRLRAKKFTGANVKESDVKPKISYKEAWARVMGEDVNESE